jgi:CHAD domain-containing protein
MVERGRAFHVPDSVTVQGVLDELGKMGYRSALDSVYRARYEYFDTQDGKLMQEDYRLRHCLYCREQAAESLEAGAASTELGDVNGSWQLYFRGELVLSQSDATGRVPQNGAVPDHLARMTEIDDLLPYLQARVFGQLMVLVPPLSSHNLLNGADIQGKPPEASGADGDRPLGLRFENWGFKSPFREGWSEQRMIVTVDASHDAPETAYLISLMQERVGLTPLEFEPLITGLDIIKSAPPGAPVPLQYRISSKDTLCTTVGKIIGRQAFKMWANTEGTLYDLDPEFLHDLRVATRRARFALKIFRDLVGSEPAKELRKELSWAARSLGRVRDIDVFQQKFSEQFSRIRTNGQREKADRVIRMIVEYYRGRRRRHCEKTNAVLVSDRYRTLLEMLRNLEKDLLRRDDGVPTVEAVPDIVGGALDRMHVWFERTAESLTPEDLHALRIEFKGLRYTTEFFSDLYIAPMRKAIRSFIQFQDCLGLYQDAQVALESLEEFARRMVKRGDPDPELMLAIGALMQVQRDIQEEQRALFLGRWNRFPKQVRGLQKLLKSGSFYRKG